MITILTKLEKISSESISSSNRNVKNSSNYRKCYVSDLC